MAPPEGEVKPFLAHQVYEDVLKELLENDQLFEDPEFPPGESSLSSRGLEIKWKRPQEIMEDAVFITNATPCDVNQGGLDDCWFLAPVAFLTQKEDLFKFVIPPNQDFERGILHFRFWTEDEIWVDVVIDSRLPAVEEKSTGSWKLFCAKPGKDKQFWCPLLEKAFAKLQKSYDNLNRADVSEGLKFLTSFDCDETEISQCSSEELLNTITEAEEHGYFLAFNVKFERHVFKTRHIYNICKSIHDEQQETFQLKVYSPKSDVVDSSSTDNSTSNQEEDGQWLPLKDFHEIGRLLYVSPISI